MKFFLVHIQNYWTITGIQKQRVVQNINKHLATKSFIVLNFLIKV